MDPLHSPSWYRVAELRPRLSPQLRFQRHVYRGESWYVLQNRVTGRVHRLTPAAYSLVSRMDGERTTQQVWDAVVTELGDDAPTQDETIWALGLLYVADVLRCDVSPDTAALFRSVAEGETGHAFGHFDFLAEVGDPATGEPVGPTDDNLRSAIAGETYEYTEMYPGFSKTAREEGFEEVSEWLETLARAEKSHAGRFAEGLESIS